MDIAETIKFRDICVMLEKVKNSKETASKEKYLQRYYASFQKHRLAYRQEKGVTADTPEDGSSSFNCILRCLIPGADTARKVYGLQITSLAKVYIKVLQLAPDSPEATRLHARHYSSSAHGSDYADVVHKVLVPRCQHELSNLTLKQVHEMLDTIAADDRRNTEKILTRLSEVTSAQEQAWFIRLLLKTMRLGIGEQRIFALLHPQAKELYQRCTSLARVCCLLADNKLAEVLDAKAAVASNAAAQQQRINLNEVIEPFTHVRPMLCEIFPGDIQPLMAADVLYTEQKMDGERFHLHYANERFKYISRNGIDYTYGFGSDYSTGNLTPQLRDLLPIDMQSIILDGEMMVWDTLESRFRDKGENTDVKHLAGHGNWRPCFVVYDLLYLNGRNLLEMPYAQRTHKMRELIKEQPGVLQTMKPTKVASVEEFRRLFQLALDTSAEGLVLKKQTAVYRPGMRAGGGWYKVKADYIEGLTTEFDLIIIGGFYNRTRTFIESFLLGVLKFKQQLSTDQQQQQPVEVYSVGKVANVLRQRVVLNESLKPHWHQVASEPPPLWYHYKASSPEGRPDVWIEPRNSTILQIRAADLAPSGAFVLSKSLHFPRVDAWRNDKVWNECMTLQEFMQMSQGKRGIKKINKRELELEDFTTKRKKSKLSTAAKRDLGIQAYANRFDATEIKATSDFFSGFTFCILSAFLKQGYSPEQLKAMVVQNGGEIVENPNPSDPKCIAVAGEITFRVGTMKKSGRHNIVSMHWLLKMCDRKEMLLKPKDMICMTDELKQQFEELYDKYGDSYTNAIGVSELKELLDEIKEDELPSECLSAAQLRQLEAELYKQNTPNYFRNCNAFFYSRGQHAQMAQLKFEWRGGNCVDACVDDFGTLLEGNAQIIAYVFIDLDEFDGVAFKAWLQNNLRDQLKILQVVTVNWIQHSDSAKRLLDVCEYTWHDF